MFVLILTLCKDICYAEIIDDYNYEDDTYNVGQIIIKRQWKHLSNGNKEHINNIQNNQSGDNSWIDRGSTLRTHNKRSTWEMINLLWRKRQNGWNRRGAGNWNSLKQLWGKRNDPQLNSLI